MSFADNLRDARIAAGLTQAELAERSGVPQATISRLEAGLYNPHHATLLALAAALDISLDDLAKE